MKMTTTYEHPFETVQRLNNIAGNQSDQGWDAAEAQMKIIDLEYTELQEGIASRDIEQVRDGIADVMVTVLGLAHRTGIDAAADFKVVTDALMSRFDLSKANQQLTKEKYAGMGVDTVCREVNYEGTTYYVTISSVNQTSKPINGSKEEFFPAGKWLKSVKTQQPVFDSLPPWNNLL